MSTPVPIDRHLLEGIRTGCETRGTGLPMGRRTPERGKCSIVGMQVNSPSWQQKVRSSPHLNVLESPLDEATRSSGSGIFSNQVDKTKTVLAFVGQTLPVDELEKSLFHVQKNETRRNKYYYNNTYIYIILDLISNSIVWILKCTIEIEIEIFSFYHVKTCRIAFIAIEEDIYS